MRCKLLHTLIVSALLMPFSVVAQQIKIDETNSWNSGFLDESLNYACYSGPETDGKPVFGEINTKSGKFIALSNKSLQTKKSASILKKLGVLSKKLSSLSGKKAAKTKQKIKLLKRSNKLIKKGAKLCKNFTPTKPVTPPQNPGQPGEPTATPTPAGPLSGNAYSLSAYVNKKLTPAECRHLLRKIAFGGNKELLAICLNDGLDATVDALLTAKEPVDLSDDPEVFTFKVTPKDPNTEYRNSEGVASDFHLVGQGSSEKLFEEHIFPLLVRGNPLKERLTYDLMDWFAVDLGVSTCSNTSGSLHVNCLYPYFKLYHDTALNFSGTAGAGTFEHLLQRQVYDVAMQHWLNNTNNCNKNGQRTNENFGRELLELFALGTHDLRGVPTYDNRSVIAAAEAASGYYTSWNGTFTQFHYYQCPNFKNAKTLFPESPWGSASTFTINNPDQSQHYSELVQGIIYKHPQSPVYIGGQIFSRLVHQALGADPATDVLLAQISDHMLNKHKYHIGSYVIDLLKSEAMFSKASYRSAIATPTDTIVRLLRLLEIPIVDRGIRLGYNWEECSAGNKNPASPDYDPICIDPMFIQNGKQMRIQRRSDGTYSVRTQYAGLVSDVALAARNALSASGDLPGHPDSVFGRAAGTAGKWRGTEVHKGHDALTPQYLLERINGLSRMLHAVDPRNVVTSLDDRFGYDIRSEELYLFSEKFAVNNKTNEEIVKQFEEILDVPLSSAERQVMTDYLGSDFQSLSPSNKETRMKGLVMLFYHHGLFLLS